MQIKIMEFPSAQAPKMEFGRKELEISSANRFDADLIDKCRGQKVSLIHLPAP